MMRFTLIYLILSISLISCYTDKEELLYPGDFECGLVQNVSYSSDVQPILSNNCYACHNSTNASILGAGNNLEDFTQLTGLINSGTLWSSLSHDGASSPMPKNSAKLSDCNLLIIETWINDGAPNN